MSERKQINALRPYVDPGPSRGAAGVFVAIHLTQDQYGELAAILLKYGTGTSRDYGSCSAALRINMGQPQFYTLPEEKK